MLAASGYGAPEQRRVLNDGLHIAVLDWGGSAGARPLLMLHPNGFCAGFFDPIARRLAAGRAVRPIGVDLRGHGATDKPDPPGPYRYEAMAADVVAVADDLGLDEVDVVGGSLGGGVAVHVDQAAPGRVRRLILCEPIAFPVPPDVTIESAHPMAAGALRRRVVWPSRAAMIDSYGARAPLDSLAPEALAAYVGWGTVDRPNGQVELACPPAVEAAIFAGPAALAGVQAGWEHLPRLRATAVMLAGDRSAVPRERMEVAAAAAGVPLHIVPGGHFFLHEDTARGVALIETHLG